MPDFFIQIEDRYRNVLGFALNGTAEIPYLDELPYTYYWVEFDFEPDIVVTVGEKYVMFCRNYCNSADCYAVAFSNYTRGTTDYPGGNLYTIPDCKYIWEPRSNEDLCFETYGFEIYAIPDLTCSGSLSWTDVKPGDIVSGDFTVTNSGDPDSLLDCEIIEWPDWGTWTFTPKSGIDLTPEVGPITLQVTVVVPEEKNQEFTGEVKIVNKENNNDFCTISILLTTQRNRHAMTPLLYQVLEVFLAGSPLLTRLINL